MPKPLETERLVVAWGPGEGRRGEGLPTASHSRKGAAFRCFSALCAPSSPPALGARRGLPSGGDVASRPPSCHPSSFSPRELQARLGHGGDRCRCAVALPVALCWRAPAGTPAAGPQPRPRGAGSLQGFTGPGLRVSEPWTFPPLLAGTPLPSAESTIDEALQRRVGVQIPGSPSAAVSSLAESAGAWTRWASS